MKLEKFKEKNNKRPFIILFTVCCILLLAGVFLYTSYASFTEDLYYAVYIDGEITNAFPSKDSGYRLDTTKSSCTNGATVSWDTNSWSALVNFSNYSAENMSRTKCTMYFKKDYPIATDYIISLADSTSALVYDKTTDNNLRYIGANPNNYVTFNNELWRIIGVMNNIDNGSGTKETRLKIIKYELYSRMAWDTGNVNDWTKASLQKNLNGEYLTSIQSPYQEMIGNAVWNLGGSNTYNGVTASMFYKRERGTTVYSGRPTKWTGKIGLMYPSDYGYATTGGNTTNRNTCLSKELYSWNTVSDCYNNDWLYKSNIFQWTLTSYSASSNYVFDVRSIGTGDSSYANTTIIAVFPVLYLSSDIKISGGTGSSSDPYQLSL